jgi:uncharacterized membrane protein
MIDPARIPGLVDCSAGLAIIGLSVPLVLKRVGMNPLYGVRIPKAFESEAHWYAINAFGGRVLAVAGVAILLVGAIALLRPPTSEATLVLVALAPVSILVLTLVPIWRYARRL